MDANLWFHTLHTAESIVANTINKAECIFANSANIAESIVAILTKTDEFMVANPLLAKCTFANHQTQPKT
jgi:hypothetical protein